MLIREFNATTREWTERQAAAGEIEPMVMPPAPRTLTPLEFMNRLGRDRQEQITAAAMQAPAVLLWLIRLTGAREVDTANVETIAGVEAMRAAGLISEQEAAALLAPV